MVTNTRTYAFQRYVNVVYNSGQCNKYGTRVKFIYTKTNYISSVRLHSTFEHLNSL